MSASELFIKQCSFVVLHILNNKEDISNTSQSIIVPNMNIIAFIQYPRIIVFPDPQTLHYGTREGSRNGL